MLYEMLKFPNKYTDKILRDVKQRVLGRSIRRHKKFTPAIDYRKKNVI